MDGTLLSTLDNFVKCITLLPQFSEKAKKLTHAICEMIARDIRLITIVNEIGFLNLLREAEPRFSITCRTTIICTPVRSSELRVSWQTWSLSSA